MAVRNAVFLALVFATVWEALLADRIHFRIYTTDLLDQHTHTRTVFIKPEKRGAWSDKGGPQAAFTFGQYPQKNDELPPPHTVSSSTMYYPPVLFKTMKYVPHSSQMHKPRPVRLVHPHQLPPPSSPIVFSQPAPHLQPPTYHAPLRVPSQVNHPGCGAFVEGSEHIDKGNCFVEQYENGYRDEESRKTFYGDGNSNVNTEKHGERNSQNFRNEAVYHHNSNQRQPAGKGHAHHSGRVNVKKHRTKNHHSDKKRVPAGSNQNHDGRSNPNNYRNQAANNYSDKKQVPVNENNDNNVAPQTTSAPPKNDADEMDEEVPTKAVYFRPLKNGKMKFIVRPTDLKYVRVHDAKNPKSGEDVKLVKITKSRKVVPGTGTKIDTVKIVENTEPLPEEEAQSGGNVKENSRKVRHKSNKSKGPVKTYKNVKVREKITRLITPKKNVKSESKVKPLWVQEGSDPSADSAEDDDDDNDNDNDNSLENDSGLDDDDDAYKVHEEQAEASEFPSFMLTPPAEESVVKVQPRGRRPRSSVKHVSAAPHSSFEDTWAAAQTEIAKKVNDYWHTNVGDTQPSATGSLFGGTDSKPSRSLFGSSDTKAASESDFDNTDTKGRGSFFGTSDIKERPSFGRPDAIDAGLAPRSFGTPFDFAISDSSEKSGKPNNDLFAPSSMQKEFLPSDPKHPVASGHGKSEKAVSGGGFDDSAEDIFEEMLPLARIIVTKDHMFKETSSPAKSSFGASDPDRLESDARAVPVVEESSHKRKGYKVTREHQLKSWR